MAQAVIGGFPDDLVIGDGYVLQWAAIDPTTGAAVSGVKVSNVNVDAEDVSGTALGAGDTGGIGSVTIGPYMLVSGPDA